MEQYLPTGKIVATHGVRGDVKAESWADSPEVFTSLPCVYLKQNNTYQCVTIQRASVHKGMVLLHLEGCDSLEDAILWKGKELYADRADFDLPDGSYFIADLIGLSVYDASTNRCYGTVQNIINRGASDIYEIEMPNHKIAYLPAVPSFVQKTDLQSGIYVTPIPGIFDEWEEASV